LFYITLGEEGEDILPIIPHVPPGGEQGNISFKFPHEKRGISLHSSTSGGEQEDYFCITP